MAWRLQLFPCSDYSRRSPCFITQPCSSSSPSWPRCSASAASPLARRKSPKSSGCARHRSGRRHRAQFPAEPALSLARATQQRAIRAPEGSPETHSEPPADAAGEELRAPAEAHPRAPVDVRGLALTVIAVLALMFALHWARTFFVSLFVGILIAYAL